MSEFRANLLSRMIALYGYEHDCVVTFARFCENWSDTAKNNKTLEMLVRSHEADPIPEDEDF